MLGILVGCIFGIVWFIVGALVVLVGIFLGMLLCMVEVNFGYMVFVVFFVVFVGGLDSVVGVVIVGFFLGVLEFFSQVYINLLFGDFGQGFYLVVFYVVMIFLFMV